MNRYAMKLRGTEPLVVDADTFEIKEGFIQFYREVKKVVQVGGNAFGYGAVRRREILLVVNADILIACEKVKKEADETGSELNE